MHTLQNSPKRLLSISGLSPLLECSPATVSRAVKRGEIAPDYVTEREILFEPARVPELRARFLSPAAVLTN
jgi:hypothetical protein